MDKDYRKLTEHAIKAKQSGRDKEYKQLVREQQQTHSERIRDYKKKIGLI